MKRYEVVRKEFISVGLNLFFVAFHMVAQISLLAYTLYFFIFR